MWPQNLIQRTLWTSELSEAGQDMMHQPRCIVHPVYQAPWDEASLGWLCFLFPYSQFSFLRVQFLDWVKSHEKTEWAGLSQQYWLGCHLAKRLITTPRLPTHSCVGELCNIAFIARQEAWCSNDPGVKSNETSRVQWDTRYRQDGKILVLRINEKFPKWKRKKWPRTQFSNKTKK